MNVQLGDIWVWDGRYDAPYLVIRLNMGEAGLHQCIVLDTGNQYTMYFTEGTEDLWEKLA